MKHNLITLIKILISLFMLWFLVHTSKLQFSLLLDLFQSPLLLFGTLSIYYMVVAISAWRWQKLNDAQQIHLSYRRTLLPTYLGIAFNNLLPGSVGGDFFRFYFLRKHLSVKRSSVMLSILFDRITGLLGIFIAVCLVSIPYLDRLSHQKLTLYFIFICISFSFGVAALYFASLLLPQKIGLSAFLNHRYADNKWVKAVLSFLDAIRVYRNSKITIIKCLFASLIVQALIAISCMLIAKMLQFPGFSIMDYILAIAVTQIVNLIPIAPGGIGVGEIAFANVLALLNPGVSGSFATIFLAYRIIGIVTYLPGIAIFVFNKKAGLVNALFARNPTNNEI